MAKRHHSMIQHDSAGAWCSDSPGSHGCTPSGVTMTKAGNASGRADYRMPDLYELVEKQMKTDGAKLLAETKPAKW